MNPLPDYMCAVVTGDDSGDDSGDEGQGRAREDEEDTEEAGSPVSEPVTIAPPSINKRLHQIDERAPSPQTVLLKCSQENMGPSAEADAEFEKELAKMRTDTSAESRRVDRKTALTLWESAVLPTGLKKKRIDGIDEDGDTSASAEELVMNFTLITKRGKQQQVGFRILHHVIAVAHQKTIQARQIAVPAESALAVQTRTAQMQDRAEQQQLKRLVLNYEQREEAEDRKGLSHSIIEVPF
jgi:regulator of nonsense transcripts 2